MKHCIFALIVGATLPSSGVVIVSSFGNTTGLDNDNQAGPIRGVTYRIITTGNYTNPTATQGSSASANSYTATHSLSATDAPAITVELTNLTWQTSSTSNGFSGSALYVSVFSGLTVTSAGVVASLGTFVGSSTNSIANTVAANTQISFNFDDLALTNGSDYQFVFTTTATPTLAVDIGSASLELKTGGNLLAETSLVGGNTSSVTNRNGWEPVFSMTYNSIPESSTSLLGGLGLLAMLRRRRVKA
jgi:hypothetical protein